MDSLGPPKITTILFLLRMRATTWRWQNALSLWVFTKEDVGSVWQSWFLRMIFECNHCFHQYTWHQSTKINNWLKRVCLWKLTLEESICQTKITSVLKIRFQGGDVELNHLKYLQVDTTYTGSNYLLTSFK